MKTKLLLLTLTLMFTTHSIAADYKIDTKGMHASIQFKISHLGMSWIMGRFDSFTGDYSYDAEKPEEAKLNIVVDTKSVNTNHAERDIHLRGSDFLDVEKFPQATFVSESVTLNEDNTGTMTGKLNLHGVEKTITVDITKIGEGKDPWGGYRTGFDGTTTLKLADYGITKNLGKASETLELIVTIEGKKQ
ncbi:MAG: YceI family protein [Marinicellaceae bacterium]